MQRSEIIWLLEQFHVKYAEDWSDEELIKHAAHELEEVIEFSNTEKMIITKAFERDRASAAPGEYKHFLLEWIKEKYKQNWFELNENGKYRIKRPA